MLSLVEFTVKFSNRTAQNQASLFNGVLTELGLERSVEINDVKKDLEALKNPLTSTGMKFNMTWTP